jgi:hypothetical protein
MARKDAIEVEGTVVELLPNTMFRSRSPTGTRCWPTFREKCASISFVSCQATKLC